MKLILVALDGSPNAKNVFQGARELAERTRAKLLLLHAVSIPVGLPPEAYAIEPAAVEELLARDAHRLLAGFEAQLAPELRAGAKVATGVPWRVICDEAKQMNVDVIAIGSHGYRGLDRLLGTTAAKVVNHADRSVLVVRAPELLDELLEGQRPPQKT